MGEMAPLVRRKRLDLVLETLQGKLELHHVGSELILCSGVTPGKHSGVHRQRQLSNQGQWHASKYLPSCTISPVQKNSLIF